MSLRRGGERVGRSWRCGACLVLALCLLLDALADTPAAADPSNSAPSPTWQVWSGADVSSNVWLLYSGVTYSPWSVMYEEGLKLRVAGGYGEYAYGDREPHGDPTQPRVQGAKYRAETYYAEFLVGYLMRFGELTAKAFIGPSVISHKIGGTIPDDQTIVNGDEFGVKGAIELWLNMGERAWGSLDMSFSTAHDTGAARARTGYRVWPKLSIGIEAALNIDAQGQCRMEKAFTAKCKEDYDHKARLLDYARAGAFVRYEMTGGELSLSVGALGDKFSAQGDTEISPYATVNWLTQF